MSKCRQEEISFEILVVDNGSTDASPAILERYRTENPAIIRPIYLEKNYGTTYPRNLALIQATGEYLCIIDSDTEICAGKLQDAFRVLDRDFRVGIVAPQLLLGDGTVQNSVKRFPTFLCKILKIPKAMFNIQMTDRDFYSEFPFYSECEVDTAISACWFFKHSLLAEVGLLDENIFYSPEDLDYCARIYKAGKKIIYLPTIRITHHTQQISYRKPWSKISRSHFLGLLYFFNKHGCWFSTKGLYRKKKRQ